jgi:hypothetical protein
MDSSEEKAERTLPAATAQARSVSGSPGTADSVGVSVRPVDEHGQRARSEKDTAQDRRPDRTNSRVVGDQIVGGFLAALNSASDAVWPACQFRQASCSVA